MKSISDNGNTSFVLNGVPTRFEMLALRNGYVGLAGSNQVRSGQYEYLELALARTHFIEIGNDQMQIYMDERTQNIFRYYGPYLMNQAEVFESYFHLDPNRSVYFTKDKGFVFDPTIELLSTVTMEPNLEETKIIASAGKFMNTIAAESELVLRGTVSTIAPLLIPNSAGRKLIYSDITINVTKSLKGKVDPAPFTFRVPGGTLNGITLEVSPMPKFKVGEEVLVYLVKQGNTWKVTRGSLGKIKL
jgi:hypothetical protein